MAPFFCRILDAQAQPIGGICVTAFPPQGPPLVAVTGSDGFASTWTTLDEQRSEQYLRQPQFIDADTFPTFTLGVTRPAMQPPFGTPATWQRIYVDVRLDNSAQLCVVLHLQHSDKYTVQFHVIPQTFLADDYCPGQTQHPESSAPMSPSFLAGDGDSYHQIPDSAVGDELEPSSRPGVMIQE